VSIRLALAGAALVPLLAFFAIAVAYPHSAAAHPLGNFTINRYSRLELYSDVIRIRYVLDMAEIPTFQEKDGIDTNSDGQLSDPERQSYSEKKAEEIARGLRLAIDGTAAQVAILSQELSFPAGQGGRWRPRSPAPAPLSSTGTRTTETASAGRRS
jgi:hypothetical protein